MLQVQPTGPPPERPRCVGAKKQKKAPPAEGATSKVIGSDEGENTTPSANSSRTSTKTPKVTQALYLNPDTFRRFIGPKNLGQTLIDGELTTCLLDNRAQLNFVTPSFAQERGMDIMSMECLAREIGGQVPPIWGIGGIMVEPIGFVLMNVKVPCVRGYNEDKVAIVMDDRDMSECPVILGTPTIYRVMEVIKESKISKLAVPWASSRIAWLMRDVQAKLGQAEVKDVANKPISPLHMDEVVRVASKCMVPPFGHKVIMAGLTLSCMATR